IAWRREFMLAALGPVAEKMGAAWVSLTVLLIAPFGFMMIGGDVSRQSTRGKQGMTTYYATRASSTPEIVKAKLLATALFVVVMWSQLLIFALGWGAARGYLGEMMERLDAVAGRPGVGQALLAGGFVVACVVNWLWLIGNLWVGLSGRGWVAG